MPNLLFIDIQFMQTSAFDRGMGMHVRSLIKAALKAPPKGLKKVVFIFSTSLSDDNINQLRKEIDGVSVDIDFVGLGLLQHDLGTKGDYDSVLSKNQKVIDDFYDNFSSKDSHWFVPCLMQEPIVITTPSSKVAKSVLWYDLMPYLFYGHYFPDQTSPYAHSYLKRINQLLDFDTLFTISETSKNDLVRYLSLDPSKIINTRGSVGGEFFISTPSSSEVLGKLPSDINRPFILLNASPEPNKNVERAIEAFGVFNKGRSNKYQLVVTSKFDGNFIKRMHKYANGLVFAGHVSSEDLKELYSSCELLFFPSLYEGLGLPPIEAIYIGKKVLCSDIPVLHDYNIDEALYWCNPKSIDNMANALAEATKSKALTDNQKKLYEYFRQVFNWDVSAKTFWDGITDSVASRSDNQRIAVVGPHPSSFSSIGKFLVEAYPRLRKYGNVDYYFDQGPSDRRHGHVRFNYLQVSDNLHPLKDLIDQIDAYDHVIYHMGNSDHHMATYLLAHAAPKTVVLHDTDLGGDGLSGQMLSNGYISRERLEVENRLELGYLKQPQRFISSLVSVQQKVVTHSDFASDIVTTYQLKDGVNNIQLEHPIQKISYNTEKTFKNRPLRLGIAGIVTEVKGTNSIEWLMSKTDNLKGAELYVFGFGFFTDKSILFELEKKYDNLHVSFDLTDVEFNALLSSLDLLINYRETYKGEASRATLEAIRERVVPIVRRIGWFDELPDNTAYKADSIEDLGEILKTLVKDRSKTEKDLLIKIKNGQKIIDDRFGLDEYQRKLLGI